MPAARWDLHVKTQAPHVVAPGHPTTSSCVRPTVGRCAADWRAGGSAKLPDLMAKKTKAQERRRVTRVADDTAATPADVAEDVTETSDVETSGDDVSATPSDTAPAVVPAPSRRRVARAGARAAKYGRNPAAIAADFEPLPADDAAIPFDRVPYVPADLRRVALMATLMIVLIIIAAFVVPRIVGS